MIRDRQCYKISLQYIILCNYGLQQSQSGLFYLSDGWLGFLGRYGFIISFQVDLLGGSFRDNGKLAVIIGRTQCFFFTVGSQDLGRELE